MNKARIATGLLLVSLCAAGLFYSYEQQFAAKTVAASGPIPAAQALAVQKTTPPPSATQSVAAPAAGLVDKLALQYLERYGDTIDQPATQAKLLGERQALLQSYPGQGMALFEQAVALAFPELRETILALVAQMALYHQWLEDNYRALQAMSLFERTGSIWQKRHQMFGDDASLIWIEEATAQYENQQAVQQELSRLDQAFEITPEEAVYQLQTAVDDIYGDQLAGQFIGPGVMANAIFSLDAVQTKLQTLPEEQRQDRINSLRKQMGYSDQAIAKLAERDQQRKQRWEKGYQYMAEREELTQRYTGAQLSQELDRLRQEHFGRSSKTIALEEDDGFYRFKRPRRLGLN